MVKTDNIKQKYTSANTSINTINGAYKKIVGKYPVGTSILDVGCGKYDSNKEFANQNGFAWFGIDPYNRTEEYNDGTIESMYDYTEYPSIIMLNNVCNVIAEDDILMEVLGQVYDYAGDDTDIYITIYEGDKSGIGKVTTKGYQRNDKLINYKDYISEFFNLIDVRGNILKVRKVA